MYPDEEKPGLDYPGLVIPGHPFLVVLTITDDHGVPRTTRWSFPTLAAADAFVILVEADVYTLAHPHKIEREVLN